jgi:SAM-dependent methyltransferase
MDSSAGHVGRHYSGDLGAEYFAWQGQGGRLSAELEKAKFEPWVAPADSVVDFGCGAGHLLDLLPARSRVGIEPNPAAREAARARGLEVVSSPAELADGHASVVISNHALEHTLAPWHELRELRLVLWLPLDDWRRQRRARSDANHHLYTWTPLLLRNLLEEAGFRVERTRVVTHAWPQFHELLFRLLPRPAFHALARAWSFVTRRRQVMALATRPPDSSSAKPDS